MKIAEANHENVFDWHPVFVVFPRWVEADRSFPPKKHHLVWWQWVERKYQQNLHKNYWRYRTLEAE